MVTAKTLSFRPLQPKKVCSRGWSPTRGRMAFFLDIWPFSALEIDYVFRSRFPLIFSPPKSFIFGYLLDLGAEIAAQERAKRATALFLGLTVARS